MGRRTVWQSTDITDPDQCQALADAALEKLGRLDICVNNAFHDGFPVINVENADMDHWRGVFDVNFFGSLNMTRACIPALRASEAGRVIFVNTMSIRIRQAGWGAYSSSKAALENITKILAKELGPDGIRVNSVLPGYIFADAVRSFLQSQADARGVDYQDVYDETAGETALKYLPAAAESRRIGPVLGLRPGAAHHRGISGRERRALDRRHMTSQRLHQSRMSDGTPAGIGIAEVLADAGITHVFGVPGGYSIKVFDGLRSVADRVQSVRAAHEHQASVMADMYGRLTGRPGVFTGQGPFAASSGGFGLMEGFLSGTPMLVLTEMTDHGIPQHAPTQGTTGDHGSVDLPRILSGMTKYLSVATTPNEAVHAVELAIHHATSGRPGPAAVVFRLDAIFRRTDEARHPRLYRRARVASAALPRPDASAVVALADLLATAKRPVIVAGNGIHQARAYNALDALARRAAAPVVTTAKARGVIVDDHPWAGGPLSPFGWQGAFELLARADAVVVLGSRLNPHDTLVETPTWLDADRQRIIQVDIEAANLGVSFPVELGVLCRVGRAVGRAGARGGRRRGSGRRSMGRSRRHQVEGRRSPSAVRVGPTGAAPTGDAGAERGVARRRPDHPGRGQQPDFRLSLSEGPHPGTAALARRAPGHGLGPARRTCCGHGPSGRAGVVDQRRWRVPDVAAQSGHRRGTQPAGDVLGAQQPNVGQRVRLPGAESPHRRGHRRPRLRRGGPSVRHGRPPGG